ncbi:hypothetical protein DM02DRAFT_167892 [Periconia macrospinosa]|uniref:Uncharacterized protein n=1 Tax=Periconia macrospinosa TaxID=97972 RepID=A0A2V1E1Z0_9PLEO|nr:hypothetical protein DM02DRAFT_167892 [Periconia macrospinosa]
MNYASLPDPLRHRSFGFIFGFAILLQTTTVFTATIPLMNNSNTSNFLGISIPDSVYRCSWKPCGQDCTGGFAETFKDTTGCPQNPSGPPSFRKFCCPGELASCRASSTGMDDTACYPGECDASEVLAATSQFNPSANAVCPGGNVNICCQRSQLIMNTFGECKWAGDAPNCAPDGQSAACPAGLKKITTSLRGDGGSQACATGRRSLCCPEKPHFNPATCAWHSNRLRDTCSPGCPVDQLMLAVDSFESNCKNGLASFCCAQNEVGGNGQLEDWLTGFRSAVKSFTAGNNCQNPTTSKSKRLVSDSMAHIVYPYLSLDLHVEDGTTYRDQAAQVWDEETSLYGEEFPSFTRLINDIRPSPGAELPSIPTTEMEEHLSQLVCAGDTDLEDDKKTFASQVCEEFDAPEEQSLQRRTFLETYALGGPYRNVGGEIRSARSVQLVLWQLTRGHLQFQYFRWLRYTRDVYAREIELENPCRPICSPAYAHES